MEHFKQELSIKFKCSQIKAYSGNCFTILIILVILPNVYNGLQYLNWMRKFKYKCHDLNHIKAFIFLLISPPALYCEMQTPASNWHTHTPVSPVSCREVPRVKNYSSFKIAKIRKTIIFLHKNWIETVFLLEGGLVSQSQIKYSCFCVCL